jgi:hypothetical protein
MDSIRSRKCFALFLCIFSRLYLLSIVAVVIVIIGDICGIGVLSRYTHQAIGGVILAGGLWIVSLTLCAVFSTEPEKTPEQELSQTAGQKRLSALE